MIFRRLLDRLESTAWWSRLGRGGERARLGRRGEALARRALERSGYEILGRGVRRRLGEIDLLAREGGVLVLVEVKTRRGGRFGRPEEAVDRRKQRKLVSLARFQTARPAFAGARVRFDVVSVEVGADDSARVEIHRGAFEDWRGY